jgi:hypothetical protein
MTDERTAERDTGDRDRSDEPRRRARIETTHESDETARHVARAVAPDNTAQLATRAEGDRVVTTMGRETTGGLASTVDDYLANLQVGAQLATQDREPSTHTSDT